MSTDDWNTFFAAAQTPEYEARIAARLARDREREQELDNLRARPRLVEQGVPAHLADEVTVGDLFTTQCLTKALAPDRRAVLVLSGCTGCGKSLASVALLRRLRLGWFVPAAELAALDRSRVADRQIFERAVDAPCLVVDDLGTETITDKWLTSLDLLVEKRIGARRTTVLTTNLRAQTTVDDERVGRRGFQRAYGPRIWSRLLGLGRGVYLESSDPDYRAAKRDQRAQVPR